MSGTCKRANSFWQLIPWHQLELLVYLQSWQTGKEFRLHWHSFVRVQINYKYWLSINRTNIRSDFKSFIAQWLALWPLESGIVSSSPATNIFRRIKQFIFIYLSFFFIFLNFEVKQCADINWKYANTGFSMEKKPNFFLLFKIAHTPYRAKQDTLRGYKAFYSRYNAFIEMKMTLHLITNTTSKENGTLSGFGNILEER